LTRSAEESFIIGTLYAEALAYVRSNLMLLYSAGKPWTELINVQVPRASSSYTGKMNLLENTVYGRSVQQLLRFERKSWLRQSRSTIA
jgi:hypothetical protein